MERCDLFKVWIEFCQIIAENELGIHKPSVLKYIEYKSKCIEFPVDVKISKEVRKRKEYRTVIKNIESSLKRGKGISMYLSKRAKKLQKDGMFIDFGILHLHLNKMIGNRIVDIAKDSGTTLQIYYNKGTVYIFNFGKHGKGAYTNTNDMQKLYDSFPNSLNKRILKLKNNKKSHKECHNISDEERFEIRKLNIATTTEIRGKDKPAITVMPAVLTALKNDNLSNFTLNKNLNRSFIELQNKLYNNRYKDIKIERDIENKEFRIINPRNNRLITKFNNDDFINNLIY